MAVLTVLSDDEIREYAALLLASHPEGLDEDVIVAWIAEVERALVTYTMVTGTRQGRFTVRHENNEFIYTNAAPPGGDVG